MVRSPLTSGNGPFGTPRGEWLLSGGRNGAVSRARGAATLQQANSERSEFWGVLPALLAGFVHWGVLGGDFRSDDFVHLFRIENFGFVDFVLQSYGGHLLLVRNAVFFLEHWLFGLDAFPYLVVALATHVLNTFLLFRVLVRHVCGAVVAVVLASLWGMSPLSQEALSWLSVYGQVLASTFLLLLLDRVLSCRSGGGRPSGTQVFGWLVLLFLLAASFGTGLAVAVPAVVWLPLLLPARGVDRRLVLSLLGLAVALPLLYVSLHLFTAPMSEASGSLRLQRSALDPDNWSLAISFAAGMVRFGLASLMLGPLVVADVTGVVTGPFQGTSVREVLSLSRGVLWVGLCVLGVGLATARGEARRRLLAFTCLALFSYGVVALGRGVLYQALVRPLWVGQIVPRYQDLPSIAVALLIGGLLARFRVGTDSLRVLGVACVALVVLAGPYATASRDLEFPNRQDGRAAFDRVRAQLAERIERSPRGEAVYIPNQEFSGLGRWLAKGDFFPGWAGIFVIAFPADVVDGRPVFFIEGDPETRAMAARWPRTRIARLLVESRP